jgi:hypothetical protein
MSEEVKASQVDAVPAGFGGWLILPAIGMVLSPLLGVIGLFLGLEPLDELVRHGFGLYAIPRYIAMLGLLIYTFMAAVRFFKKRSNAPATLIKLLIARVIIAFVFFILGIIVLGGNDELLIVMLLRSNNFIAQGVAAAIWVPYFRVSKRVKATFVN